MNSKLISISNLKDILEVARFAPSVHNTQPYRVELDGDTLCVKLDPRYVLKEGDPTGRETVISLGIFVEALSIAAQLKRYSISSVDFQASRSAVRLKLKLGLRPSKEIEEAAKLLRLRCTDRSIYKSVSITPKIIETIMKSWQDDNIAIHVITGQDKIDTVADLTAKGISVALSNPSFRKELSHYLTLPFSRKRRGISTNSLQIPWLVAICQPILLRLGLNLGAETRLERKRWVSASGVVAITSPGDMPKDWFSSGRAYLRVSLAIEKLGLSQATSAATVEASNYHEDIESMLHTKQSLQSMIRIGSGSKHKRFSPRVSAELLIG